METTQIMQSVKLYHNAKCGTSRNVLTLLRERGIEPEIIEYLTAPPSQAQLKAIIRRSGLEVRAFMRHKEALYTQLDLDNPKWTDADLIGFLADYPVLFNRPVVVTPKGVRPCRPAEAVLELID